jgi:glutamate racemase
VARTGRDIELRSQACPAFVEFVERGDTSSPELRAVAVEYLTPLVEAGVDTLILGCTHYPLLRGLIAHLMGPDVTLVSSAEETAKDVYATLVEADLLRREAAPPAHTFLTTGDPAQFQSIADRFLGPDVASVRATSTQALGAPSWS